MATQHPQPRYAIPWERLSEFVGPFEPRRRPWGSHYQLLRGARDEKALARTVNKQLTTLYNQEATAFSRALGGGEFKLDAAWKQRELQRKSRVISKSLKRTFSKERDRIAELPFAERSAARAQFVEFKDKQLDMLLRQEANFQAQTDVMAHSGSGTQKLVDVSRSRVMYFQNLGDRTCDFCIGIASGNPYTIQQSTTLGAGAHPNCACAWTQEWTVDPDVLRNARRQVEDGEVRIWSGAARTPVGGKALTKVKRMQVRKGGWRGRRIEQKKVIYQKTGQKVKQPYATDRVFPRGPVRTTGTARLVPGQQDTSEWLAGMSMRETEAINQWSRNAYPEMRIVSRMGTDGETAVRWHGDMVNALDRAKPYDGTVYRAISELDDNALEGLAKSETITLDSMQSSSFDIDEAKKFFLRDPSILDISPSELEAEGIEMADIIGTELRANNVLFEIENRSGIDIVPVSELFEEAEVVLRRGARYNVLGRETVVDSNGIEYLHMMLEETL